MRIQHPIDSQISQPVINKSSIFSVEEVKLFSFKKKNNVNLERKTRGGKSSIYAEGFQALRTFPTRRPNNYDPVEKRLIKPSVMLTAHLNCINYVDALPRKIIKKDRTVKFDKKYANLFKKNYSEVFEYNLFIEENIAKNSSKKEIRQATQKLFEKYESDSKQYLRDVLFENPSIVKSEKCKYLDTDKFVTIYYNQISDLFAVVDTKKNTVVDFGIATEVTYAEIFAYKSSGTLKISEICESLNPKYAESTQMQVFQENYVLSGDTALAILRQNYDSKFTTVSNGEFRIEDWQAAKKIEHAVCFGIKPEDYGFSQDKAREINSKGGIVLYLQKGNPLPPPELIKAFQNAVKNFCEDRTQSNRNDESIFQGSPAITFFNSETRQIAIFDQETKTFRTAYKLDGRGREDYLNDGIIGNH